MKSTAYALGGIAVLALSSPAVAADVEAQDPATVVAAMQHKGLRQLLYFKGALVGSAAKIKCVHMGQSG